MALRIKDGLTAVGGGVLGGVFVAAFYGVILFGGWWSIRVTIWFFTAQVGDPFPLPWQPFS